MEALNLACHQAGGKYTFVNNNSLSQQAAVIM